jgi:mono/diheme cytochrome c family protein
LLPPPAIYGIKLIVKTIPYLLIILALSSCFKSKEKGALFVSEKNPQIEEIRANIPIIEDLERQIRLFEEKELEWQEIQKDALFEYKKIEKIVQKKCYDCHDSDTKLPFYGRIFPSRNPVNRHQVDGVNALDLVHKFPLKAQGNPPQVALLKSFRNAVVDKTMPLKIYTKVYPFRKIKKKDQVKLLAWINPLIERIESFNEKYDSINLDPSPKGRVKKVFANKCMRCHGNGVSKGGFGGMEDLEELKKSKYVNIDRPTESELYLLSYNKEMPPNIRETLSEVELQTILEWIAEESQAEETKPEED